MVIIKLYMACNGDITTSLLYNEKLKFSRSWDPKHRADGMVGQMKSGMKTWFPFYLWVIFQFFSLLSIIIVVPVSIIP